MDRVYEKFISTALKKLKSNMKDAIFDNVSDCYINGSAELPPQEFESDLSNTWDNSSVYSSLDTSSDTKRQP